MFDKNIEDRVTCVDPGDTGCYVVTTWNYTRHLLNLQKRTITRNPAPGHEWCERDEAPIVALADHAAVRFLKFENCRVGDSMYVALRGRQWRLTSEIRSIRQLHALNRSGMRITDAEASRLLDDPDYRSIAHDRVRTSEAITLWFGYDQSLGDAERPLIFGSIVKRHDGSYDWDAEREAATEGDALANHEELKSSIL